MNNVVDFQAARQEREQQQAEPEYLEMTEMPPIIEQKLNEASEKVLALTKILNTTLDEQAKAQMAAGQPLDSILIPIEALVRELTIMTMPLDALIKREYKQTSDEGREQLTDILLDTVHAYYSNRAMTTRQPVFQHDMYVAMANALLIMIHDHRVFQLQMAEAKKGETSNEVAGTEDVQEEGHK